MTIEEALAMAQGRRVVVTGLAEPGEGRSGRGDHDEAL
jgi:hypothetical protein